MPCEGCNVQFTVFRRKRCCSDCKRFYCNNCLTSSPSRSTTASLCERCAVFAKRPLSKVDLLQLKPKDLIFYLQSKHISTAGCVEKDELVGLVLNHIHQLDQSHQNASGNDFSSGSNARSFDSGHSFDALKQSCQNFFSNISDKVDSFTFEAKQAPAKSQTQSNRRSSSSHITEQPRVSTREIPSYASFQNRQSSSDNSGPRASARVDCPTQSTPDPNRANRVSSRNESLSPTSSSCPDNEHSTHIHLPDESSNNLSAKPRGRSATQHGNSSLGIPMNNSPSFTSQTNSPIVSLGSSSPTQFGTSESSRNILDTGHDSVSLYSPSGPRDEDKDANGSGCECSDDEIITSFRARTSMSGGGRLHSPQSSSSLDNPVAGPSGSSNVLTSTSTTTKKSSPSLKIESYDESSESSFEELGAIGGISDDSKTAADSSVPTSERWQFVEKDTATLGGRAGGEDHRPSNVPVGPLTVAVLSSEAAHTERQSPPSTRPKKVTRRRSDSYLNRRRPRSDDDDSPTGPVGAKPLLDARSLREEDEADNEKDLEDGDGMQAIHDNRLHCKRCGKNRTNIKKHVERMRRHLENSQMAETEIKRELEEFLVYLEKRTKSIDCSDSETTTAASGARGSNYQLPPTPPAASPPEFFHRNESRSSIHVYATPSSNNTSVTESRFINLEDFNFVEELENLSVKQLKEILMLNRVDYKGCCEKQELLDRVVRLWKNLKSTPAVEKLPTDELCKICMDAPIECVILECGHMATCTNCGKVLSECPICRQYIVRVVRFFKA